MPQDSAEAAKWLRLAADQGDFSAELTIGWSYEVERGVARNYVQAYNGYNLATATASGSNRDSAVKKPSPAAQQHYKVASVALKNNDLGVHLCINCISC